MEASQIARINELAHLAKERELTAEETAERARLRKEYLEAFRANTRATFENTLVEYPDGTRLPLSEAAKLRGQD